MTHSEHNYNASKFLLDNSNYYDWVVTTSFYSCLHSFNECAFPYMDHDGNSYSDFDEYYMKNIHGTSKQTSKHKGTINLIYELMPEDVGNMYRRLHELSSTARYKNYIVSEKKAKRCLQYAKTLRAKMQQYEEYS